MAARRKSGMLSKLTERSNTNEDTDSKDVDYVGDSLKRFEQAASGAQSMTLSANQISRRFNPRNIPFSIDEVKRVQWPSLDIESDRVSKQVREAIENALEADPELAKSAEGWTLDSLTQFFSGIHLLSQTIRDYLQLQEMVVYRSEADFTKFILIAGERRLIAFAYGEASGSAMPDPRCLVLSEQPSPLLIAQIKDYENTLTDELDTYELLLSKKGIYDAYIAENPVPSASQAAKLFSYKSRAFPSVLIKLFSHPECDQIIQEVKDKGLTQTDIISLLSSDTSNDVFSKNTNEPETVAKKLEKVTKAKGEAVELQKRAKKLGFNVSKRSDLTVLKHLVTAASQSSLVTKKQKEILESAVDAEDAEGLVGAILKLADLLES